MTYTRNNNKTKINLKKGKNISDIYKKNLTSSNISNPKYNSKKINNNIGSGINKMSLKKKIKDTKNLELYEIINNKCEHCKQKDKENEKLNKLTQKQKLYLNSPLKNEMKDCLIIEKTITSKNLFSEIKENRTKTRLLPKIQYSTTTPISKIQKRIIKLPLIEKNKKYQKNNEDSESSDLNIIEKYSNTN